MQVSAQSTSTDLRPDLVMQSREAIARGVMDTPELLDVAADRMIDRESELLDAIVGIDVAGRDSPFWTDPEDTQ